MKHNWIPRKSFMIALCVLVGIPVATYWAWGFHQRSQDRAFAQATLLQELAHMGAYTSVLSLLEEGRDDKAKEVLEFWVASSAESSRDLVRLGTRLDRISINLLEGVRRTNQYAEQHELVQVVEHTTDLLNGLSKQP